jgi:hypothetical protein
MTPLTVALLNALLIWAFADHAERARARHQEEAA